MDDLSNILDDLRQVDSALSATELGDFAALEATLEKRACLVRRAAAALDALRPVTPEQYAALRRSHETGSAALRQLILAQHMLATELSQLKQEQRLWDTMSAQLGGSAPSRLNIEA